MAHRKWLAALTQQSTLLPQGISVKTKRNKTLNGAADRIKEQLRGISRFSVIWQRKVGEKGTGGKERRDSRTAMKRESKGQSDCMLQSRISRSSVWEGNNLADVEKITRPDR